MEAARYRAAAKADGQTLSAWLRSAATRAAERELSAEYHQRAAYASED